MAAHAGAKTITVDLEPLNALFADRVDLLTACKNALGAYDALLTLGIRKKLPGYDSCLNDLKAVIAKVEGRP